MARIPPIYLLASQQRQIYERLTDLKRNEEWTAETEREVRTQQRMLLKRQWKVHLQGRDLAGARVRDAILPVFND